MSNSASLSAAKRRRGGGPPLGQPPMQGQASPMAQGPPPQAGGNLPPGLPPNFRQMPPQLQQQILRQMQQRMMQAQQQQQAQQNAPGGPKNIPVAMSSNNMNEKAPPQVSGPGPYVVNSVLHNRAISEIDGIHIRDLPMSAAGLPCLPSGAALPPNILFKLHHDELLNQDATINDYSNRLQMLTNRVDKIERGVGGVNSNITTAQNPMTQSSNQEFPNDMNMNGLASNTEFIAKVLDNILTNTNLSDIINQIEPLQKENESLRALIHSQQTTLNELSTMVMKLINGSLLSQTQQNYDGENTCTSTSNVTGNFNLKYEDINDVFCNYVNSNAGEVGEAGEAGEIINNSIEQQDDQQEGQDYSHKDVEGKNEEEGEGEEQGDEEPGEEGDEA